MESSLWDHLWWIISDNILDIVSHRSLYTIRHDGDNFCKNEGNWYLQNNCSKRPNERIWWKRCCCKEYCFLKVISSVYIFLLLSILFCGYRAQKEFVKPNFWQKKSFFICWCIKQIFSHWHTWSTFCVKLNKMQKLTKLGRCINGITISGLCKSIVSQKEKQKNKKITFRKFAMFWNSERNVYPNFKINMLLW